jgi:hypothetical protein
MEIGINLLYIFFLQDIQGMLTHRASYILITPSPKQHFSQPLSAFLREGRRFFWRMFDGTDAE